MLKEFQESLTESFRNTNRTKLRYFHDNLLETLKICDFDQQLFVNHSKSKPDLFLIT